MPLFEQSTYGDLFVEYVVVLPTQLSSDSRRRKYPFGCASCFIDAFLQTWRKHSMARAMRRMSYRIDAIYAMYTPLQGVWRGMVALDIILFALYHLCASSSLACFELWADHGPARPATRSLLKYNIHQHTDNRARFHSGLLTLLHCCVPGLKPCSTRNLDTSCYMHASRWPSRSRELMRAHLDTADHWLRAQSQHTRPKSKASRTSIARNT